MENGEVRRDTEGGGPRSLPAGAGPAWLASGWELFRRNWGIWVGIAAVVMVLTAVAGMIPVLGAVALNLLLPVFGGGLMLGCRAQDSGERLTIGHLFAGFRVNTGALVGVGALYLAAMMVLGLLVGLLGMGSVQMAGGAEGAPPQIGIGVLLVTLVAVALYVPVAMAVWFAPALVALRGLGTLDAVKLSFFGCLRNIVPFLIHGLILFVLALLASIPMGLGFLVLVPVAVGSQYAAYKAIFV